VGRVAADLATDPVAGLAAAEAASRLARFGENVLVEQGRKPAWRLLAGQFANTMIVVLLLAAVVAAALGDLKDTVVILAILVLNGLLGFVQEYWAEQALAALKAMAAPVVRVRRGGRVQELPTAEVVPGDLVLLGPGDPLPADLRLTESWALRVNEAALAGKLGVDRDALERDHPRVAEVAFDATRRGMTTLHQVPDGMWAAVRGAVDALVTLLDEADAHRRRGGSGGGGVRRPPNPGPG
jgi:magnesium-transporting ATPase (P-type)